MLEENSLQYFNRQRFTLRDVAAIGFRYRQVIGLCVVGIIFGAVLAAIILPQYRAEAKFLVTSGRVDPVIAPLPEASNPIANYELTPEQLNSEVELLNSYDLLRKVVVACDLHHSKSYFGKLIAAARTLGLTEDQKIDKATMKLAKEIDIQAVPKTNVIQVAFESADPQVSSGVLASLSSVYLDKNRAVHRASGQFEFFEAQTQIHKRQLEAAESRLADLSKNGTVVPEMERDLSLQKLSEFSANLQQTWAAQLEVHRRIHNLLQQASETNPRMNTQVRSADNPQLLQQLKSTLLDLELKRNDLLTKFQPSYRLVLDVDKQIAETLTTINAEYNHPLRDQTTDVNPVHQWLESELAKTRVELSGLQARGEATRRIVEAYEAKVRDLDQKRLVYEDLVRSAKAAEANYLLYLRKQEESRMTDALDEKRILNVAVVEEPIAPALPVHSPLFYGIAGALLAIVLSVGLIFSLEYLHTSFRTPREVENLLQVRVLAALPHQNGNAIGGRVLGAQVLSRDIPLKQS
jgi:uncharacterized protein involved in exopolysaccharide biosynthesis